MRGRLAAFVIAIAALSALPACASNVPPSAQRPGAPVLTSPASAVRSYLDWISYAYRIGDSGVATATFSPAEEVRVDSYVEYNRQHQRAIDQRLTQLTMVGTAVSGERATVRAREHWRYRYILLSTGRYEGRWLTADYQTTYSLVRSKRGWSVDGVQARPLGTVR